ncbi:MAG: O-methyltransferase [Methanoregulaceae archaeon PtaU1.Bin222]|nr:MAG: O-methyltransferase [Methanoregulaceae archaeon PtaU1.Bin222]
MIPEPSGVPTLDNTPASGKENPLAFLDQALGGLRCFQAFFAAYDMGIFDTCKEPATLETVAAATGCTPGIAGPLCEGLVRTGFLSKDKEGRFTVTEYTRDFFLRDSPFSQKAALAQMREYASLFLKLHVLLTRGPVVYPREKQFREKIIPAMAEQCRCGLVQRVAGIVSHIPEFPAARKMLDLGGGHGLYSLALIRKNPDLHAVIFDLPDVTDATREFIRQYGAPGRVSTHAGDFFRDPLGSGYDIVFSSSNPSGKMPALIPKIRDALKIGGLYLNKQVIDNAEQDPFSDLEWNLWVFEGMQKQDRRFRFEGSVPLEEYNRRLRESGFIVRDTVPVDARSVMTIAQKE